MVGVLSPKYTTDIYEHLVLGSPETEHLVFKLFDYTCPHCREMHHQMDDVRGQFDGKIAVVLVLVPMNTGCNKAIKSTHPKHRNACLYARLALAVWRHKPEAFTEFHVWMMEDTNPPPPDLARRRAGEVIGHELLEDATSDPRSDEHIAECVKIYEDCGSGRIPKLILNYSIVTGETKTVDELLELLKTYLQITPEAH